MAELQNPSVDLKEWKKAKLDSIRSFHSDLIKDLGISPLDFNMKKAFYDTRGVEVVGIFGSEFRKEKGFFFELISSDLDPIDPERKVYRVPPNTCYEEEYELNPKNSYNVPLEELRVVNSYAAAISKEKIIETMDENPKEKVLKSTQNSVPLQDSPYSEMTIRDYYAIHTGKPVSLKSWLNDLIKTSK
jgi:hypothetical protein